MKEAYLRSVGALLDCPAKDRERLLGRLEDAVDAYLADAPGTGETDLVENFGTPEVCAARLMEECDLAAVAAVRRKRKRRSRMLIVALAALLALAVGVAAYLWSHGGLVVIQTTHYESGSSDNIKKGQIIYAYED